MDTTVLGYENTYPRKECITCGRMFQARSANMGYCSPQCRTKAYRHRSKGTGTIFEMRGRKISEIKVDHSNLTEEQIRRVEEERELIRKGDGLTSTEALRAIGYLPDLTSVPKAVTPNIPTAAEKLAEGNMTREEMEKEKARIAKLRQRRENAGGRDLAPDLDDL